ncbi:MAG: DUF4136 domain-containing protein [Cryomorphaceae bacterium]|nr:DUF4136 domain-containing protein [Flavobacteriales bacterium]
MMKYLAYIFLIACLSGCYPQGPKYTSELDLAVTNYDIGFDFESADTYILVDSIFYNEEGDEISRNYDQDILNRIEANMSMLGFTRADTPESPGEWLNTDVDVVITVSAWSETDIDYYSGYYPAYWDPGWGWYYPPGWGFATTTTYGSVLIDMSDPSLYQEEEVRIVWSGLINGMINSSSPSSIRQRIDTEIDICFSHPPFNN